MKFQRIAFASVLLGLAAAFAAPSSVSAQARPWEGSCTGTVTIISASEFEIDWEGISSHLGSFTRHEHVTVNEFGVVSGTIVFTAASGDELEVAVAGQFVPPATVEGTYSVTRGEGRFEHATGEATFTATTDFSTAEASFEGTLDY